MYRILIVDDDPNLRGLLVKALRKAGWMTTEAENGAVALERHQAVPADLIVLDLMMPRMDGFAVLRALRPRDEVPVLLLTAEGQERKRVEGFRLGADDYLVKPFSLLELVARIRAILKRTTRHKEPGILCSGPFELDRMHQCLRRDGASVGLSPMEYHILEVVMSHAGQPLTRLELLRLAWKTDARPSPRTVDVHMVSLRRKLMLGEDPPWILTSGTQGYCWTSSVREKEG
jgi:DNA-binding response OmpR family regulator